MAIETVNLVKRYPVRAKALLERRGTIDPRAWFKAVLGRKGSYITALNDVTLRVWEEEVFGLLGPNGAGKTTLIKILSTLVLPDGGEVYVNGIDVVKEPHRTLRRVQAVLGGTPGFEWRLSARKNLEFYAALYGLSREQARRKIDGLLEFAELSSQADDMFQKYSTGMAKRLLLCRALLRDVPLLLFDEPTVGLDPRSAAAFRKLIRDGLVRSQRKTVLLTTHNLWEAHQICDRIAIIDRGGIVAVGSPEEVERLAGGWMVLTIALHRVLFDEHLKKVVEELQALAGVITVKPQIDSGRVLQQVVVEAENGTDLSAVLELVLANGLKVKSVDTSGPSLEDAFLRLTEDGGG